MRNLRTFGVLPVLLWMSGSGLNESRADEGVVRTQGEELLPRLEGAALTVVPLAGEDRGPLSGQTCAWHCVVVGLRSEDGSWSTRNETIYTKSKVLFETPLGRMVLRTSDLRLHLEPSWDRRVRGAADVKDVDSADVQGWVLHLIEGTEQGLDVVEYCLKSDETIAARVQTETFMLPPSGPEQAPQQGSNTVLQLWSGELRDGDPARALTPPYDDWTY